MTHSRVCALCLFSGLVLACTPEGEDVDADRPRSDAGAEIEHDAGARDAFVPERMDAHIDRVVGTCEGLGAIGEWEPIAPTDEAGTPLSVLSVLTHPGRSGTLFLGTNRGGLQRSDDCGATWTKVNTGRSGDVLDSGGLWDVTIDPVTPDRMWAGVSYGTYAGLLRSENGGADWDRVFQSGSDNYPPGLEYDFFQSLSIDPTNHDHVLITWHASCGAGLPGCMSESYDAGDTWRTVHTPYNDWGEAAGPMIIEGDDFIVHTLLDGVWYTTDGGDNWHESGFDASAFQAYRAADGYLYLGGQRGFHRSLDGLEWTSTPGPNGWGLTGDGERMFTATRWGGSVFYARPELGGDWAEIPGPVVGDPHEATEFAYDPDHFVLYIALMQGGLQRMVTRD